MTSNQSALLAHLKTANAKTQEWLDATPDGWAGFLSEDLQHSTECGVTSVAEFIHYNLAISVYESIKAVCGYKPSWPSLMAMTNEDLQKELDSLNVYWESQAEHRKAEEEAQIIWEQEYDHEQFLLAEAATVDAAEYFGWDR